MGRYVLVIIASGRLRSNPIDAPLSQGGRGMLVVAIRKPIAKRFIKEPSIATGLSFMGSGTISKTSTTPKMRPAIVPDISVFITRFIITLL